MLYRLNRFKRGAGEGRRSSVRPPISGKAKCYVVSKGTGMANIKQREGRINGFVTYYVGTAF